MGQDQLVGSGAVPALELDAAGRDSFHTWYLTLPEVRA